VDLFRAGAEDAFAEAIKGLTSNKKMRAHFDALASDPEALDPTQFLKDIDSVGKGRLAQRLATIFLDRRPTVCPAYIKAALDYMKARLA
jgi:putative ATP-dependent endonuclease of the OLD family